MKRWLLISFVLILFLSSCSFGGRPLSEEIVGKWINAEGYEVEFYPDGQGFIPGVEGAIPIPDSPFSYRIEDESKLFLTLSDGTTLELVVTIKGDKMTWASQIAEINFEYTRVK
jgi:uncharacterized lipoprotein YehR (DUF1307 family)